MTGTKEPWHLDKRVPVALIIAIIIQTGGAAWFAGIQIARIDTLERDVERQRLVDMTQTEAINRAERQDVAQSQKLENILDIVERMDRRLERLTDQN